MLTSLLLAVSDPEQPEPSESTPREVRENTGDVVDGGPASPSNVSPARQGPAVSAAVGRR